MDLTSEATERSNCGQLGFTPIITMKQKVSSLNNVKLIFPEQFKLSSFGTFSYRYDSDVQ